MALVLEPPDVPDLIARPELATLHALDLVVAATITAVTAAHADVFWDEDLQFEAWPDLDAISAAEDVLKDARKLRRALGRYQPDRTPPWLKQQLTLNLDTDWPIPF